MMRRLTNPLFLYLAVWIVAGISYLLGINAGVFPDLAPITAAAVLLSLLAFALGYGTWRLFGRLSPGPDDALAWSARPLRPEQAAAVLKLTALMGLAAFALGLYRVSLVASHSQSSFFELLTNPGLLRLRLVIYIETSLTRISYIPILISLTSSLFAIGFVLLGVYLYLEKARTKYLYLAGFLLISLAIGLTNLSRYEVTVNVLYLIFAYGLMYASGPRRSPRQAVFDILLPLVAVAVLFVAIDLLLGKSSAYGHADRVRGALFSLYWYLASPLAAFNEFIAGFDGPHGLGQHLFYPFYKWLHRLSLVGEPQLSFYGEMTFLPFMTNVYTYLRNVYEDFGMLGVALVPYLLGWASCAARPTACRSFAFLNLYVVLLALILFSFYNYFLMSNQVYLQIVFGFVFFRWRLDPRPGAGSNELDSGWAC